MGTRIIAPLILKLCTGWMWVTSFTHRPPYQNEKCPVTQWTESRLCESYSRAASFKDAKNLLPPAWSRPTNPGLSSP